MSEKSDAEETLAFHLRAVNIPHVREYRFDKGCCEHQRPHHTNGQCNDCAALGRAHSGHEHRKPCRLWRVDFYFPEQRTAVEVEGAVWTQGRHTRGSGFVKDMEKYNALTMAGIWLLRFTPKQVTDGVALQQIERVLGVRA